MQKVKWIFFAYIGAVALVVLGIAISFGVTPTRDPTSLYAAYFANIKTLDPAQIGDTMSAAVGGQVFECLYNYDYLARPYKIIPELADGMPAVSPDGLTVIVHVKPGIHYFSPEGELPGWEIINDAAGHVIGRKGPEIKAGDFVYSWKRVADFNLASTQYSQLFEGKIKGIAEWRDYTKSTRPDQIDWDRPMEGFQALDDHTVQIKLIEPYPQFIYNLAHLPSAPVSRDAIKYWGNVNNHPIGSGAYYIAQHLQEQRIVFKANPIYRGGSDVPANAVLAESERLPKVQRVQLDYFEEELPAWALFQQGLLDAAGIPKDTFTQAINPIGALTPQMQAKGIILRKDPLPVVYFYGFNMEDPILGKNKPLRQAMSMAFDRKAYIDLFYNGRGQPATGPIPPGFPTYDPKLRNPNAEFNLKGALEKMKDAVKINGGPIPTIRLLEGDTGTTARQMGEFIARQMAQIDVHVEIEYTTWARFLEKVDARQAQFYQLGWQADYPDEQTFLQLFWSKNVSPGPNGSNYNNPKFDALYEKAVVMQPGPERDKLYHQMVDIAIEDTPWLLTFYPVQFQLMYAWVGNVATNEYAHGNRKFVTLDLNLRRQKLGH